MNRLTKSYTNFDKKTIVIVFDKKLLPIKHGNQARVFNLLVSLRIYGYKIVFICNVNDEESISSINEINYFKTEIKKIVDEFISIDGPLFNGDFTDYNLEAYKKALSKAVTTHKPLAVIVEYFWLCPCLDILDDNIIKIVDTHDLMHQRKDMYLNEGINPWITISLTEEIKYLSSADIILGIQENESQKLKEMLPDKTIVTLLHTPGYVVKPSSDYKKKSILILGSNNTSNRHGLSAFIDHAWPHIKIFDHEIELIVAGGLAEAVTIKKITLLPNIIDCREIYKRAHVVLNTTILGTGLKIKTVEGLCNSKAIITTQAGADGLEDAGLIITDDWKKFSEKILTVIQNNHLTNELQEKAYEYSKNKFSRDAVFSSILKVLNR